jgi:hypothetical protein
MNRNLIVFILLAVACAGGCVARTHVEPASTRLGHSVVTEYRPDGSRVVTERREGEATGPGGTASGDNASLAADGKPADIDITKGTAKGGGGSIDAFAEGSSLFANPFTYACIVLLLGSIGLVYVGMPTVAIYTGAGSIVCGVAAVYPVVFLFGGLALVVLGAGWAAYSGYVGNKAQVALRAVVAGVANAPGESSQVVKEEIAKAASVVDPQGIKATVDAVKRKL